MLEGIRKKLRAARYPNAVVLGAELAEAERGEKRHRRRSTSGPSGLAAVTYEPSETSLSRFQSSQKDDQIRRFVAAYSAQGDHDRVRERDALTMDDFYTLLMFPRRCCIAALRTGSPEIIRDGLHALAASDEDRVDPRDLAWAADASVLDRIDGVVRSGVNLNPADTSYGEQVLEPANRRR